MDRRRPSTQTLASTVTAPPALHFAADGCSPSPASPSPRTPRIGGLSASAASTPTTSTTNNYYYAALVSPIHQRFIELGSRLRRWRIFRPLNAHHHRSTSHDPAPKSSRSCHGGGQRDRDRAVRTTHSDASFGLEINSSSNNNNSRTCPVPRKKLQMDLTPRRRPNLDPVSSSDSLSPEEVSNRFQQIQQKSGILNINGTVFEGVKFTDLERVEHNAQLGDGTGGSVFKFKFRSRMIAVKQMKRTDSVDESKRIFMDLDVISRCNDCPYIVKYYGYIITFDFVYICMEVMATCLENLLKSRIASRQPSAVGLPEEIIAKIALSVVRALDYLKEQHKIMHRDVKPSNILLDWYGNFKLCDFGISGKLIESKAVTNHGCTGYLAPERINIDSSGPITYDVRADIWSLGISLFQLATGRFPYECTSPFELMIRIKKEDPPMLTPETHGFSPEFCLFVADCLQKDMAMRPKFKDLLTKPFLQQAANTQVDVGMWFASPAEYEAQFGRS